MYLYTSEGTLQPTAPFDFIKSLNFLARFLPMQDQQTITSNILTKAVAIKGQAIVFQLHSTGTVNQPHLAYTLYSKGPMTNEIIAEAVDRARFFLSMDDDLRPFYEIAHNDAEFAPIVQDLYGYHQVKFLTPFENACWAILTQRNPQNVALSMKNRLTETYGASITLHTTHYWAFPQADHLKDVGAAELQTVIRNTRKVEHLLDTIKAFNEVNEQFLRTGEYSEVVSWLQHIKGFGEWSVSFVLLRGLGRMESIPLTEKVFQQAASRVYGHGRELSTREVATIAEKYGSYKGYWSHYLRVGA